MPGGSTGFFRASVWSLGGTGAGQLLRLLSNLVLWRLLFPEAFGLMALVNSLMIALAMFSDVGIGPSIIQDVRGVEKRRLHTAYTIQSLRGFVIFLITCMGAIPMARFYGQPELALYIPAVGLTAIFQGTTSMRVITETRKVRMDGVMRITLISQVVSTLVMIVWALLSPSVWALVVGNVVGAALRTLLSFTMLPGERDDFAWDQDSARAIFGFGRWVFASTLLTFVATQSDRLLFGKMITLAELGAYSIAQALATMPDQLLSRMINSVLFPYLSRTYNEGKPLPRVFQRRRKPVVLLAAWMCTGLMAAGPPLVLFLYGPRAGSAQWILPALAAGTWLRCLRMAYGSALMALGQPKWVAASTGAKVVAMAGFITFGYLGWGFPGAVAGYAASELVSYVVGAVPLTRHDLWLWGEDLVASAAVAILSTAGLLWVTLGPSWPAPLQVAVVGFGVSGFWGGVYWFSRKNRPATTIGREKVALG